MRQKIKKVYFYGAWLMKFSLFTTLYLIISLPLRFNKKYKNLWIIAERPDEARDNGYWLYKWILENHPEVNLRYILSRNSADYQKMPRKNLLIEPNSARHYIYYILSSYSISTHMHGACPGKSFCIPFLPFMRRKKTIFLQHGITKDAIKFRGGMDTIIACSDQEKKLIESSNPNYKGKVRTIGFCRYDSLSDLSGNKKQKIILVMPTFRKWLRDIGRLQDADNAFRQTAYFKAWNSFLNNPKLEEDLGKNNMRLIFFPHKEMQALAHNFSTKSKNITIGKPGDYDIQTLLRRSSILITDYSSVLFDFIYMNKPVLFYQFDQQEFFSKHYPSAGKAYPFGDTFTNEQSLMDELAKTIKRGCKLKNSYEKEAKKFFKFRDHRNCERNFNAIKDLK